VEIVVSSLLLVLIRQASAHRRIMVARVNEFKEGATERPVKIPTSGNRDNAQLSFDEVDPKCDPLGQIIS
jgi:hypothetical protein